MEVRRGREEENELKRGREGRNEKGYKKAEEFRKYLDGERSARDPRFDLKVFQFVHFLLFLFFFFLFSLLLYYLFVLVPPTFLYSYRSYHLPFLSPTLLPYGIAEKHADW